MKSFTENKQWQRINERIKNISQTDLETFKRNEGFFIFATQSPKRFGMYYLKLFLSLMARNLTDADFLLLDKIENRLFGNPISIRARGRDICIDYLQALYEAKFIKTEIETTDRIIEIGAGYGRTCHTVLSLYSNITEYIIIDLEPCLNLAKKYLSNVLEENLFKKIKFIPNLFCDNELKKTENRNTLSINCDSLGEMDPEVSRAYLDIIHEHSCYFYSCNPVGKYDPTFVEEVDFNPAIAKDALSAGLLTDVINIFDDTAVSKLTPQYLEKLKPHPSWKTINHKIAELYSHYIHVVFSSN